MFFLASQQPNRIREVAISPFLGQLVSEVGSHSGRTLDRLLHESNQRGWAGSEERIVDGQLCYSVCMKSSICTFFAALATCLAIVECTPPPIAPSSRSPAVIAGTTTTHPAFGWTLTAPEGTTVTFENGVVYENGEIDFYVKSFDSVQWGQMLEALQRREAADSSDAKIFLRETKSDYDLFAFHSSGQCAYRKIFVHIDEQMLESEGMCDGSSDAKWERLLRLARSLKESEPIPAVAATAFDECGPISNYKNADWFGGFEKAARAIAYDPNVNPSFGEGCVALDGSLFIVTWIGESCQGNRLLRYDISHQRLAVATANSVNDASCGMRVKGFGKRNGESIPVQSVIDTDNCDSTFNGTYNVAQNRIDWGTPKVVCEQQYY